MFEYDEVIIKDGEEDDLSTQFLRIRKKNQLIDFETALRAPFNTLACFGLKNRRYNFNLVKS